MKIIQNKYIPPKGFSAITLFGIVFANEELTDESKNHESIHIMQGNEMLWFFFYIWYVIEWIIRLIQYRDKREAYFNISFEREAYANQKNFNYKSDRKFWGFIRYISDNK